MPQDKIIVGDCLVLDPATGRLDVLYQGQTIVKGATAELAYRIGGSPRRFSLGGTAVAFGLSEQRINFGRSDGTVQIEWHIEAGDQPSLSLEVTNISQRPIQVDQFSVLSVTAEDGGAVELGCPTIDWSFYQNGWQSWSPAFARHVTDGIYSYPGTDDYRLKHQPHPLGDADAMSSEWFTVLGSRSQNQDSQALLIGFVTACDQLSEVQLTMERWTLKRLEALCHADGVTVEPGGRLRSERLIVVPHDDPLALLDAYARALGQSMRANGRPQWQVISRLSSASPTGWCSWYYFHGSNTSADVLANLAAIDGACLPLEVILIDDGYQPAIGDWLMANERFPEGMQWLAQKIKAAGHRPGIWIAPFGVAAESRLYAEHPDWVIHRDDGYRSGQQSDSPPLTAWRHQDKDIYALDLSHPAAQEWLASVFRTLAGEWGYELFKIDFCFAAALEGRRHNPEMTRAQALRRGLEIIRQAIGAPSDGARFLLGCGMPLAPAVGLIDGMRIGPDVSVNWEPLWADLASPAAGNALRNTMARAFTHGVLWANDPDCVLARDRYDESDLVLNEMRTLVSLVGLSGGSVFSGDNLPSIRRGRLKYLRQILPPLGQAAVPLDLFERERPELFALPIHRTFGDWLVVGVINWGDRTRSTTVDLAQLGLDPAVAYHAYHYWLRRYLGVVRGRVTVPRHQPHETALLLLKPVSAEPDLLTSTFHITQGGVEVVSLERWKDDAGGQTLVVGLNKAGVQFGKLLFTVPAPWRVIEARVDGRRRGVVPVAEEVVSVGFTLSGRRVVEVQYRTGVASHGLRRAADPRSRGDDPRHAR